MNDTVSESKIQENGIPQGSILSVILFVILIDGISKLIPKDPRFHASLYMDDLQISYSHTDINIAKEKLQPLVDKIAGWADRRGFRFSSTKMRCCILQARVI